MSLFLLLRDQDETTATLSPRLARKALRPVEKSFDKHAETEVTEQTQVSERSVDTKKVRAPPEPSESSIHGKEVHVAKQKQTQKEVSINNSDTISVFLN